MKDLESAFASTADPSGSTAPCPEAEAIWDAVCGASTPETRRRVVDHLAVCGACSEAWRLAVAAGAAPVQVAAPRRSGPYWLAAAAVLIAAASLWIAIPRGPEPEYRQGTRREIASLVPQGAALARHHFRLRWSPVEPGAIYRLRVATADLDVLATVPNLAGTEYLVPAEALGSLPRGATIVWQVDAVLTDGRRVSSPSFSASVE
ncbi:MAG TPA: hypothetical protein VF139_18015 [Candidatus Polarisedimenticolaceae bacterium]